MATAAIRAFIAIEIHADLQNALRQVIAGLQNPAGKAVRWVTPHNVHLTLKFMGNVSPSNLNALMNVIRTEAQRHPGFDLTVSGLGAYPNKIRPRILWAGVQAPTTLVDLQRGMDRETERLGYLSEEREFSPHLTLGRISQHAGPQEVKQVASALGAAQVGELGRIRVSSVRLFRSDLQPGGAVYTSLLTAPLASE